MKRWLFVILLTFTVPGTASAEHPIPKASIPGLTTDTAGYMTFPLHAGKDGKANGCLWRLPVISEKGLEVYAALSTVRTGEKKEAALQIAGSIDKDGKKHVTSFSDARLTAGPSFDTETIAGARENGPTARITFPGVHSMAMVTAINDHDAKLFFTHDGKKHEVALPRPTGDDTAHIWFCLTELQGPADKKPVK